MPNQIPSRKDRPVPEAVMQILQQAETASTDQTNPARRAAHDDFTSSEPAEDYVPPPPYGEIYGQVRNEKNGLGTSAHVTDDGRVNVRINQVNRHLSQIFSPALRQQLQGVQDSESPPRPYVHTSSTGDEQAARPQPPPLNVVIQVVGSRGDVQPFVALGKVLKETYGHRVRLATHPTFKAFVQQNGLEFFSIGGDPSRLMAFMVKNPGLMPGFRNVLSGEIGQRRKDVAEYIQGCWRSCYEAGDGLGPRSPDGHLSELSRGDNGSDSAARPFVADCIIANPPSFAHIHCAEKLGIPLHIMFTMPYSPTQAFPHPLANIQSSNADPQLTNYMTYAMIEVLTWQGIGDIINRFRAKCLGLDPVSMVWGPGMLQRLKIPHTYCWSPALIPKPKDWSPHISISGFYFLNLASDYTPAPELQAFLDAGPPPAYIGFGSIVLDDPDAMTQLIFEAVKKTGQRVLLSKGWGGIGLDNLDIPDGIFILGNVPHDWLFKHVSCVVHHGGAGTTAAGITAGRPTVVVPFFGDQPFWGAMVARAGAGPDPIPHRQLTADKLADAIDFCLRPESLERAKELASKIAAERGSDTGAHSFHQFLEPDRLRCTLAPSRSATWRVKRTKVKLSAFAACTLANAGLLEFNELKLFRPQEHETDEGPSDPVSGGFVAACGAFSGMVLGLAETPSETLKALQLPFKNGRQQSQAPVSKTASKDDTPTGGKRSDSLNSLEQSQPSLDTHETTARVREAPDLSCASTFNSNTDQRSMFDAPQGQLDSKQDDAHRSQVGDWDESNSSGGHDMLRQNGVHTSKGLGRLTKAFFQSPMDVSMGVTKGFHNLPKLWGDDTVRSQPQISDLRSGARAAGKQFVLGWYDGVTGLVTQPWNGARKDGAAGFLEGFGKGIGGFATKPNAALMGVLGYTMKGIQKEVQKLLGGSVQTYIVASRTAQGYEEWLQSSDVEKQDVIDRWKLIQKHLKKKANREDRIRDILEAQQKEKMEHRETRPNRAHNTSPAPSGSTDALSLDSESAMLFMNGSPSSEGSLGAAEIDEGLRQSLNQTSQRLSNKDADVKGPVKKNGSRLQRQPQEPADQWADREELRQAMAANVAEARRQESEELEYERQLEQVMAQSLSQQRWRREESESMSRMGRDGQSHEAYEDLEPPTGAINIMAETPAAFAGRPPGVRQTLSYDPGHLEGIPQNVFEAQIRGQEGEKTAQEKTEEEIVMQYVKKQSLLEEHHQSKDKGRATATEEEDEFEGLQRALKLSLQDDGGRDREASRM